MKTTKKNRIFSFLGGVVLFAAAFDIFANFGDWTELLWFCPVTSILLSIGLFRRNAWILSMCLILSVPGQSMWIIDFIFEVFGQGAGRTAFLEEAGFLILGASVLTHAILIPVSMFGVYKTRFESRALVPAIIYTWTLLAGTYFLTPSYKNVNCVFFHCDAYDPGDGYFRYFLFQSILLWPVYIIIWFFALSMFIKFSNNFKIKEKCADNA